MSQRNFWITLLIFAICAGFAFLQREVVAQVAGLQFLSANSHRYFLTSHPWLLCVLTPLVVACSFILYLSPGAIMVLALNRAGSFAEWVVLAFGSSTLFLIILSTGAKFIFGPPLNPTILIWLWLATTAGSCLILTIRLRGDAHLLASFAGWANVRRMLWMICGIFLAVIGLIPKIFWENFNLDGVEAFEFGRSLTTHLLPHWEIHNGIFGFYQNFILFAYPNHWFISLFGPWEASARLPFILYLVVLFAALILLIELKQDKPLGGAEEAILAFGLVLFAIVQTYNTNYEPFFADIAEMAATDTLWVFCFISTCYCLWSGRTVWFYVFATMTYLASPGGLLLLGALAAATFLARASSWRQHFRSLCFVISACLVIGISYELIYNRIMLGGIKDQFSSFNMMKRLYPPTITEFVRVNALLFPSGILPALALVFTRRKESMSWTISLIAIMYFVVIYTQAWTSLHQFTPVMVLPLIVFWRFYLVSSQRLKRWLLVGVTATTALSLFLSLPRHFRINQAIRQFGQKTEYRIGDYERAYEQAIRAGWTLYSLLPEDYRLQYPEQPWGADPPSWIYYATREKPPGTEINYVIQPVSDPPPSKTTLITSQNGISVYVSDMEAWQRDRGQELPRVVVSYLYEPILRQTYAFFRAYVERQQQKIQQAINTLKK